MFIARSITVLLTFTCFSTAAPADMRPAVRATDPIVIAALARGAARSPTFGGLLARLQASDVIVHVERRPFLGRAFGATTFVTATPTARYLRITLHADSVSDATIALLGHELQHAVEVADQPTVRDEAALGVFYRRIGTAGCEPPRWCFDTAAAVNTGRRVHEEIRGRWRPVRLAAARHQE